MDWYAIQRFKRSAFKDDVLVIIKCRIELTTDDLKDLLADHFLMMRQPRILVELMYKNGRQVYNLVSLVVLKPGLSGTWKCLCYNSCMLNKKMTKRT